MVEKMKKAKKKLRSPSAFTVLFIVIAMMAGLTWVIPSGEYQVDDDGNRVSGSYSQIEKVREIKDEATGEAKATDSRQGAWDVMVSPIKGMSEKLDVIVFVLILGGFLGVVMKTGALDATLGAMLKKMKGKEQWLIPILMTFFAIGGTTYGMQEEAVAFYALVVPVMLAAGYNAMTAVMVIVLGGGVGVLGSTINPFSTGIAAKSAGSELGGSLLLMQAVILVLSLLVAIGFTMRYAAKVKSGHYKDDVRYKPATTTLDMSNVPAFTGPRKAVMAVFGLTFVLMILSLIPWEKFGITAFLDAYNWVRELPAIGVVLAIGHTVQFGDWYFNEISTLFLISTLVIAAIYYRQFKKEGVFVVDTFLKGTADLLSVALIIAVAAGVGVVMQGGAIQDTIISWGESLLRGSGHLVGILAYFFYLPMSFIIPSSSGLAAATMPVIAPVADLVGSSKDIIVVAFATASGLLNMMAPTIASLMGGLALAGVSYRAWLKRTAPIMAVFAVISLGVIALFGAIHG
ncbi:MAG: YfcC family protein [Candidatus Saccharibacteria bacterium]|nr:YfcC family protein [Candidatus Saccharibacteria bacterium]